ncbi:origin recognition complex subunit Orc1 [Aspergillus luchuensis]|uniref:Origin recognition complex subunit Orc1 n=1 Tax=Aspergillus kawachii TaxID=1069201 RepID=A0A146FN81_ASPKA|nr:origin recognition complex subunit Orc1 [Aspergillus luchuensis]
MQASKGVPLSDPALDRPRLKTDMCKNVDLPMSAFAINHLGLAGLFTLYNPFGRASPAGSRLFTPFHWANASCYHYHAGIHLSTIPSM